MSRKVSEDVVIRVWLNREFEGNWERKLFPLLSHIPNLSKQTIKKIIDNPDYKDEGENRLRLKLLWSFRSPLLLPLLKAKWSEENLSEPQFRELCVINASGWDFLSKNTGRLSQVAKTIHLNERTGGLYFTPYGDLVEAIHKLERTGKFNKDLILLESKDTKSTTILEGNRTAVALYIKHYLKKEFSYKTFKVFLGYLDNKCCWQW